MTGDARNRLLMRAWPDRNCLADIRAIAHIEVS
jgi:hypothetical protein